MAELPREATYVRHHKQKILLVFAAMRAFAEQLSASGKRVLYYKIDDAPPEDLTSALHCALQQTGAQQIVMTEPGEYRLRQELSSWDHTPITIRQDDRFLCSHAQFAAWASGKKQLRMEFFYREMRKQMGLLMNGREPEGGQWNYDVENRKKLPKTVHPPVRPRFDYGARFAALKNVINELYPDHFGTTDQFCWPITHDQAEQTLSFFITHCLENFGTYQDAMTRDSQFVFHSLISTALNMGLLDPLAVCQAAERAYYEGLAPLNAVEGFIRQVLGWREFIRGIYWLHMPDYEHLNALQHDDPLPAFYYTGETDMACLHHAITTTREQAYAHHIQRLMITGNFALLAGLSPEEVNRWYMEVYADAYQWVELPNTHGMALYADGGIVGSKPYAASGAYINRMSDYCKDCAYNVKDATGPRACPFNYLYWNFMIRHEALLGNNPRMGMVYKNLARMDDNKRTAIISQARTFLSELLRTSENSSPGRQ